MRSSSCSIVAMAVGGPAAVRAQLAVDHPVRLLRAVVVQRDERVELLAQLVDPLAHRQRRSGWRRGRSGGRRTLAPRHPLLLPLVEQRAHLLGLQQPRQAQVVLLVGRERRALVDQLVELGVRGERRERLLVLPRLVLGALRLREQLVVPLLVGPVRLAQHVVALRLQLARQAQQHRHRRHEHRRRLPRPPRPHEPADGLREEQRRRGARRVHARPRGAARPRPRSPSERPPSTAPRTRRSGRCAPRRPARRRARRRAACP